MTRPWGIGRVATVLVWTSLINICFLWACAGGVAPGQPCRPFMQPSLVRPTHQVRVAVAEAPTVNQVGYKRATARPMALLQSTPTPVPGNSRHAVLDVFSLVRRPAPACRAHRPPTRVACAARRPSVDKHAHMLVHTSGDLNGKKEEIQRQPAHVRALASHPRPPLTPRAAAHRRPSLPPGTLMRADDLRANPRRRATSAASTSASARESARSTFAAFSSLTRSA